MRIEILSPTHAERYERFLLTHPETLLYVSWRYQSLLLDVLCCRQQTMLAIDADDNILAALPLMAIEGPFGTVINSLPFYGSNGALIGEDPRARAALIVAYERLTQAPGMAASTIIENPLAIGCADELTFDFTDERIGQFSPLPFVGNEDLVLMQSFHYKTRNMIRKAERQGVEVSVDNNAMSFLQCVHHENMLHMNGLAKPQRFFDSIARYFRSEQDYRLYVAHLKGELVAALLVFFYNRTVEYYTPVIRNEYRDSQALSAIIFRAMRDAAAKGYSWWNWGGTWRSQHGVYRFKSRWGTRDMPYRYYTRVHNPLIMKSSSAELLAGYPSFFTVPFSALST
jgi:hypothetical protein